MTPSEKAVVKSLVAVAWVDGHFDAGEAGVVEGLLVGFDASEAEERELVEYAATRRALEDIPLDELTRDDRELLLANAGLLTHADGDQSRKETEVLGRLVELLGFSDAEAHAILAAADDGARRLKPFPEES